MRKNISLVAVLLLLETVALLGNIQSRVFNDKGSTKIVEFSVFLGSSYSSPMYRKSKAKVILTVYKFNKHNQEILWKTVIDKGSLRNYPFYENQLYRKVSLCNIREHKDELFASYEVIYYNTSGSEFSYEQTYLIQRAKGNTLPIAL